MRLPALVIAFALMSCRRDEDVICDKSASEMPEAERAAHRARCFEAVDRLKPGVRDCVARCYKIAVGRDALFDCDTKCRVKIQE